MKQNVKMEKNAYKNPGALCPIKLDEFLSRGAFGLCSNRSFWSSQRDTSSGSENLADFLELFLVKKKVV